MMKEMAMFEESRNLAGSRLEDGNRGSIMGVTEMNRPNQVISQYDNNNKVLSAMDSVPSPAKNPDGSILDICGEDIRDDLDLQ